MPSSRLHIPHPVCIAQYWEDGDDIPHLTLNPEHIIIGHRASNYHHCAAMLWFPAMGIPYYSKIDSANVTLTTDANLIVQYLSCIVSFEDKTHPLPVTSLEDYLSRAQLYAERIQRWGNNHFPQDVPVKFPLFTDFLNILSHHATFNEQSPLNVMIITVSPFVPPISGYYLSFHAFSPNTSQRPLLEVNYTPLGYPPKQPENVFALHDLTWEQLYDGFAIVAITSQPCHLYCRMTTTPPDVHRNPTYRRGSAYSASPYFCFVAYEDNEQLEEGDTTTHTFLKHNWPHCETRYFYFYGTKAGIILSSTTPVFDLHFKQDTAPKPTSPYVVQGSHIPLRIEAEGRWADIQWTDGTPLRDHIPEGTTVLLLHYTNIGILLDFGLKPDNSAHNITMSPGAECHLWAFCPTTATRWSRAYIDSAFEQTLYLEGYLTKEVATSFPEPIDRTPPVNDVWYDTNLSDICPGAQAILLEVWNPDGGYQASFRPHGSPSVLGPDIRHGWFIVPCDINQHCDFYTKDAGAGPSRFLIWGYITDTALFQVVQTDLPAAPPPGYTHVPAPYYTKFALLDIYSPESGLKYSARGITETHDTYLKIPTNRALAIVDITDIPTIELRKENGDVHIMYWGILG
jgi:hypothetical protein